MYTVILKAEENAHENFQRWRRENQEGFIINFRSPADAMLHRSAGCLHLGSTERPEDDPIWGSFGNTTKYCSNNRQQLIEEMSKLLSTHLKYCKSCNP